MSATYHKEHLLDTAVMLAFRAMLAVQPKMKFEPASRPESDALMEKTAAAEGVAFEAASIAGIAGWWCRPPKAVAGCAILYLHGGAYVLGSAAAYRNFCSQIAMRAEVPLFIAEYSLAPEHPFPRAVSDAEAVYRGLEEAGFSKLAVVGDSAGGGLALSLIQLVAAKSSQGLTANPVAGVVFSPWADLALTGESLSTRASADPLLTREELARAATFYLGDRDRRDPMASPLFGNFAGFPPTLLHVGESEVLLDDARRAAERIASAGGEAQLNVWQGMTHVFVSNLLLQAAKEALDEVGRFLRLRFSAAG